MTKDEVYRKLDDKIKDLKSTRVFKKVTPKGDLSWYIKWVSVVLILIATSARVTGTLAHIDLWFGLFGTIGWFIVGYLWHDRALILLNGVLVTLIFTGLLNYYFGG
jgi:vacuolar-type H+-ATPase subunit I/STV1